MEEKLQYSIIDGRRADERDIVTHAAGPYSAEMDGDTQSTIVTAARETELETPSGAWWGDYELRRSSRVAARPSAVVQTKSDADWERITAARRKSPHTASAPEIWTMRSPAGGSSRCASPGIAAREQGRRTE